MAGDEQNILAKLERETARKNYVPTRAGLKAGAKGPPVEQLQRYLSTFGYLESPVLESFGVPADRAAAARPETAGVFDENTVQALRHFQERNGLESTGELDEATIGLMKKPRCGFPD